MSSTIVSALKGGVAGITLYDLYADEKSVRAGRNGFWTSLFQSAEIEQTIWIAEKVFSALDRPFLSLRSKNILQILPLYIIVASSYTRKTPLHSPFLFMEDRLGALCQLASFISAVALIWLGQPVFGGALLLTLTIGCLDQHGLLPEKYRHFLHRHISFIASLVALFFHSSYLTRFFCLSTVLSTSLSYFSPLPIPSSSPQKELLTKEQFQQLLSDDPPSLKIKPSHLDECPLPPLTQISIQELCRMLDDLEWTDEDDNFLRLQLSLDERFSDKCGSPETKTNAELRDYAQNNLHAFVSSIENHLITDGEPLNYEIAERYLKAITDILLKNEGARANTLITLAVQGGEYCGPGKYDVIEAVYTSLIEHHQTDFRAKVLIFLQQKRERIFQKFYSSMIWYSLDRHYYNLVFNLHGNAFHLHKLSAQNDRLAFHSLLVKKIASFLYGKRMEKIFKSEYTPDSITLEMQQLIGLPCLPRLKFYEELRKCAERCGDQEVSGKIERGEYEKWDGKIKPEYIEALLIDMGILEYA